jgi:hypothetical protein
LSDNIFDDVEGNACLSNGWQWRKDNHFSLPKTIDQAVKIGEFRGYTDNLTTVDNHSRNKISGIVDAYTNVPDDVRGTEETSICACYFFLGHNFQIELNFFKS